MSARTDRSASRGSLSSAPLHRGQRGMPLLTEPPAQRAATVQMQRVSAGRRPPQRVLLTGAAQRSNPTKQRGPQPKPEPSARVPDPSVTQMPSQPTNALGSRPGRLLWPPAVPGQTSLSPSLLRREAGPTNPLHKRRFTAEPDRDHSPSAFRTSTREQVITVWFSRGLDAWNLWDRIQGFERSV